MSSPGCRHITTTCRRVVVATSRRKQVFSRASFLMRWLKKCMGTSLVREQHGQREAFEQVARRTSERPLAQARMAISAGDDHVRAGLRGVQQHGARNAIAGGRQRR